MGQSYRHEPVLLEKVIEYLNIHRNSNFFDATTGGGGHAEAILSKNGPHGRLLAVDLDTSAVTATQKRLHSYKDRATVIKGSYVDIEKHLTKRPAFTPLHGIVLDLGLSSDQLDNADRGFSFKDTGNFDLRFDTSQGMSASELLLGSGEEDIHLMLRTYGEVPVARKVAKVLMKLKDEILARSESRIPTQEIVQAVSTIRSGARNRIHPATLIFQAFRIAVNKELSNVAEFMPKAISALALRGRLVIISYHSLEDRLVKQFFKKESKDCICEPSLPVCRCEHRAQFHVLTSRAIVPTDEEVKRNPRSRSAHLRAVEKI